MKQLMMGFAACALLLTGCTEQDITERVQDGQGQLNFSTGIGKQATKTAELMNSTLQTQANDAATGIALRTYKETEVSGTFEKWFTDDLWYETPKWKISSTRFRNTVETKFITYFPKTYVSEVADSFNDADFAATDGKFPAFTCTVAANSKEQKDLIAGITEVVPNQTDITIGLRHILSQVNFGTRGYSGAIISIQNIKIVGLYNSATYTYGAENKYPIGDWTKLKTGGAEERTASYEYYDYSNDTKKDNPQPITPAKAKTGDVYVFGDGGNAGPGRAVTTWYPIGVDNAWGTAPVRDPISLGNSLMLMPQDFMTAAPDAKVTFEYQITDVDGAYVAGGPTNTQWAKGEFKLDFKTGDDPTVDEPENKYYLGKWEQNFRYLYLIDFTDFLDGSALTFTVDVEAYPWENYNNDGGDDGIINIMAAGQPTPANMNAIKENDIWYIASQNKIDPATVDPQKWAQVIRDETWNLSTYDFTKIEVSNTFNLNFRNVIFNTKNTPSEPTAITFTLPEGFKAEKAISVDNGQIALGGNAPTYTIKSGDRSAAAAITITNVNYYRTSEKLKEGIEGATTSGQSFVYGGTKAVNLTEMVPTGLTTAGNTITVKFTRAVIPTIGATTNGNWAWDAATQTATWTKVDWSSHTLAAAKTAIKDATADAIIYCSDVTEIASLAITFDEPENVTGVSTIKVVFNNATATRTPGAATANGAWTYSPASKTATWTKNPPDPQP